MGGFIAGHWRGYFDKIEPLTEEQANAILDSIERTKQPPVISAPTYTFRITDADYFNSDKAYDDDFECEELEDALLEFNQRLETNPNHISVKLSLEVKSNINGNDGVSLYPIVQWDAREEQLTIYKETATNPEVAMNEEITRSIRNLSERDSDFAYAEVFIKETEGEDRFTLMQTSQDYPDTDNMYAIWDNLYGVYYTDNDGNMSVFPSMEAAQTSLDYLNDHPLLIERGLYMIQVHNVSLIIKKTQILHEISIDFEKGKIHGLIGRNGSGKTMLMKCICGFINAHHKRMP